MKIIGFNLDQTYYGLPLDNGGACLIEDGEVKMVTSEERLNRKQYSAGYKLSFDYLLRENNLKIEEVDLFVASSCLEPLASAEEVTKSLATNGFDVPTTKIKVCDHHLSHAYNSYYPSGFDEAIIMVLDGDGNVLADRMEPNTDNPKQYWLNKTEHNSYYIGKDNSINLLDRDDVGVQENGFGGLYRYFTYFCGFYGYRFAGKLMGLSAYGSERNRFKDIQLFDLQPNGRVKCLVPDTDRLNSPQVVETWLKSVEVNVKARKPEEPITEDIEDIAYLVQRELDRALIHKVKYLVKKTGIKNLCVAGGVGLNAVTNRALLDNTGIENIFIQPASGDSGECMGNAYFGLATGDPANVKRKVISVYQGKEYSNEEIVGAFANKNLKYKKVGFPEVARIGAQKLSEQKIIAWFQGRSEIGPRALGNRSILANPINKDMKDILNARVKHREAFRPFAPSVLEEKVTEWFDISIPAPYMIMNAQVKQPEKIPSVTHVDGSARLQTVSAKQNERYHTLISEFEKLTGVPVVLNTSFNDNEAIVESPVDAVNTFLRTNIDFLFIGDYVVEKVS